MILQEDVRRTPALRQWFAHLVLIAFACRALIPIGYMPDFNAASKGSFKVVICTGNGSQVMQLDANGHDTPSAPEKIHSQPCAFSSVAAIASLAVSTTEFAVLALATEIDFLSVFENSPPTRAGPTLGSRGPPRIS